MIEFKQNMDDLNLSDSGDDEMKDDMKQVDHESAIAEDEMYHYIIKHEFLHFTRVHI